jgi:membrane-bound ClpP family serine protease
VNVTEDPFFNASIVMRTIHNAEREKPIRVIISTYGGLLSHCQKILHWLKLHPGGHIAYVNEAYSAGAMVALSAGEIVMTEHSFMGKIDPQVAGEEPVIYQRLHERSRSTNRTTIDKIDYTMLAAVATMNTMEKILNESVANYSLLGPVIKEHFIYGETRHYTVFYLAEMKAMGFNVREPTAGEEIYFGYYQN